MAFSSFVGQIQGPHPHTKKEMVCLKVISDISSNYDYFVSESLEKFIKQNFLDLWNGHTFIILMEGMPKQLFMTRNLQICIKNVKED